MSSRRRIRVERTEEFRRVMSLPKRILSPAYADAASTYYTRKLARCEDSELRRWQGPALKELVEERGLLGELPVGFGKTLILFLAMVLLRPRRAVIIVRKSLITKTQRDFDSYHGLWKTPRFPYRIISRGLLQSAKGEKLLQKLDPDFLGVDEADEMANARRSAAARITRFRKTRTLDELVVLCLTGTLGRNSILDYWHLLYWTLGPEKMPLPATHAEVSKWASALDNNQRDPWNRALPGPLGATRADGLRTLRKRLRQTPGVMIVTGDSCDKRLTIRCIQGDDCPEISEAFERLVVHNRNSAGVRISDALSVHRMHSQASLGFETHYAEPGPPEEWLDARRRWARHVRRTILRSQETGIPLDTEARVFHATRHLPITKLWERVRETYKPKMETTWFSTRTLRQVERWLDEQRKPAIVWVGSVDFAKRLSKRTRLPYFGAEGKCAEGGDLDSMSRQAEVGHVIAGWMSNMKGLNLQKWSRACGVDMPQSGKWLEQTFGRTHRADQLHDVELDIIMGCGQAIDAFEKSIGEADFGRESRGAVQKILNARVIRLKPKYTQASAFRWACRKYPIEIGE